MYLIALEIELDEIGDFIINIYERVQWHHINLHLLCRFSPHVSAQGRSDELRIDIIPNVKSQATLSLPQRGRNNRMLDVTGEGIFDMSVNRRVWLNEYKFGIREELTYRLGPLALMRAAVHEDIGLKTQPGDIADPIPQRWHLTHLYNIKTEISDSLPYSSFYSPLHRKVYVKF